MHLLSHPIASKSAVEAKGVEMCDLSARERDARVKRIGLFSSYCTHARVGFSFRRGWGRGRQKETRRKENRKARNASRQPWRGVPFPEAICNEGTVGRDPYAWSWPLHPSASHVAETSRWGLRLRLGEQLSRRRKSSDRVCSLRRVSISKLYFQTFFNVELSLSYLRREAKLLSYLNSFDIAR